MMGDKQWRPLCRAMLPIDRSGSSVRSNNLDKSASGDILPSPDETGTMFIRYLRFWMTRLNSAGGALKIWPRRLVDYREEVVMKSPRMTMASYLSLILF